MKPSDFQLDHSHSSQSRDAVGPRVNADRRYQRWEIGKLCGIVVATLVLHWLGMQCLVTWLGGEDSIAHSQTTLPANAIDDGWRRTAQGWEYLGDRNPSHNSTLRKVLPTVHVSPSHVWPAAAAACMILLIAGLPDKKSGG